MDTIFFRYNNLLSGSPQELSIKCIDQDGFFLCCACATGLKCVISADAGTQQ